MLRGCQNACGGAHTKCSAKEACGNDSAACVSFFTRSSIAVVCFHYQQHDTYKRLRFVSFVSDRGSVRSLLWSTYSSCRQSQHIMAQHIMVQVVSSPGRHMQSCLQPHAAPQQPRI